MVVVKSADTDEADPAVDVCGIVGTGVCAWDGTDGTVGYVLVLTTPMSPAMVPPPEEPLLELLLSLASHAVEEGVIVTVIPILTPESERPDSELVQGCDCESAEGTSAENVARSVDVAENVEFGWRVTVNDVALTVIDSMTVVESDEMPIFKLLTLMMASLVSETSLYVAPARSGTMSTPAIDTPIIFFMSRIR